MKLTVYFINAFTDALFKGNPAAVIITQQWLPDILMQSIATENNLSETAFVVKSTEHIYAIRWFSPIAEVAFCGHATLASAHVLFNQDSKVNEITFSAAAVGELKIKKADDGDIQMSFPNRAPEKILEIPADVINALSIAPDEVYRNQQAYFAIYNDEHTIRQIKPNIEYVKILSPYNIVATAPSKEYDFISRYFWPDSGGGEDPVTGSIHAGLTPFWAARLNKHKLTAYQASTRGGKLKCELSADRVLISGRAIQYLEGCITL